MKSNYNLELTRLIKAKPGDIVYFEMYPRPPRFYEIVRLRRRPDLAGGTVLVLEAVFLDNGEKKVWRDVAASSVYIIRNDWPDIQL